MRDEKKDRISKTQNDEVPKGYKKTKIGIVPSEWEVVQLRRCLKICSGKDQKQVIDENGKYPILGTGGEFGRTNVCLYNKESVLIGRKGSIDKPQYMDTPFWTVDTLFFSEIFSNAIAKFIYYKFNMINWYKYNEASGVPSLNSKTIEAIKISLPPLSEQQKIAEILTTQDKVIELKEKLIAEKEQQKKYLVQNLLTGKKRLKGFSGELKKVKLGKVLKERKIYSEKGLEYQHVTLSKDGIYQKSDRFDRDHLVKDESKNYKITKLNDICYNPANLKFGVICKNTFGSAIFSPIYVTFEVSKEFNIDFIAFCVTQNDFIQAVRKYEQGTVYERMSVSPSDFLLFKLSIPPVSEQNAIAEILSTADREIELLKADLLEEKQKKKALMQLLLTGIVRV